MTTAQRDEVREIVSSYKTSYGTVLKHRHPELVSEIVKETSFLNNNIKKFSTRVWYVINDLHHQPSCKCCHKNINKDVYKITDPRMDYCSLACACSSDLHEQHRKEACLKKHGVDHPMKLKTVQDKVMKTNLQKRGVAHALSDPFVIEKRLKTFTDHCNSDPDFKRKTSSKIKATMFKNHGFESYMSSKEGMKKILEASTKPESKEKRRLSKMTNFFNNVLLRDSHVTPMFTLDEYLKVNKKDQKHLFRWKCNECGNSFERPFEHYALSKKEITFARCPHCHPFCNKSSLQEKKVAMMLSDRIKGIAEVICNKEDNFKIIAPFQLDILIREFETQRIICAVEYNGSRWHSLEMGSTLERQLQKTKKCERAGFPLVHIWEDEWQDESKRNVVLNFICAIVRNDKLIEAKDDVLTLRRDMFSKALAPEGYELTNNTHQDHLLLRSDSSEC